MQDQPPGPAKTPAAPAVLPRTDLTYEEFMERRKRRLLRVYLPVLLTLGLLIYFGGKPAYRATRAWQARRAAREASALIAQEKWSEASRRAQDAYLLRPNEPEAVRVTARLLTRIGQPAEAVKFWDELAKLAPLRTDDRRDYASCALAVGQTETAEAQLAALAATPGEANAPANWLLNAELAATRFDSATALEQARKVMTAGDRATPRERFIASLLSAAVPDPAGRRDATVQMTRLADGDSAVALDALVWLARQRLAGQVDAEGFSNADLIQRLNRHPAARPLHHLLAFELEMNAHPEAHDEIVQRAVSQYGQTTDREAFARLVAWLNEQREPARVLELLSPDQALTSAELFASRLDALGALGHWNEVKSAIDSKRFPLDPIIEEIYVARALAMMGEVAASENRWKRAREAAAGNVERLNMIARFAERAGAPAAAEAAYRELVNLAPDLRPAQEALLNFLNGTGDTAKTHAQIRAMLRVWPADRGLQNDDAYFLALRNQSVAEAAATAERLYHEQPASLPHRTALALARLRLGQNVEALELYRGIIIPPGVAQPSTQVVYAAALRANGFDVEARAEADRIPRARLKKEERVLLQEAIQ